MERHVKNGMKAQLNESTVGPTNPMFANLKKKWYELDVNDNKDKWYHLPQCNNPVLNSKREEAVIILTDMVENEVFPRSDYRQVSTLSLSLSLSLSCSIESEKDAYNLTIF